MGSSGRTTKTYALFHGSPSTDIEQFDVSRAGKSTSSGERLLFFTDSRDVADEFSYERLKTDSMFIDKKGKKGRVYEVDVSMQNPLDLTNLSSRDIRNLIRLSYGELTEDMVRRLSAKNNQLLKTYVDLDKLADYGYDGIIARMYTNSDAREFGVINSDQVRIRR